MLRILSGEVLQWYIICALAELFVYIVALILSHNKIPKYSLRPNISVVGALGPTTKVDV
jgi:hypothetical protein